MNKQIGMITKKIIKILKLDYEEEKPIFVGDANLSHMREEHPKDFSKYGKEIDNIIINPTY